MTSLERKLRSAEDQLAARPDVVVADDHVFAENRKLVSLVDKYNAELNEAHREIRELKSRLVDSADAKERGQVPAVADGPARRSTVETRRVERGTERGASRDTRTQVTPGRLR